MTFTLPLTCMPGMQTANTLGAQAQGAILSSHRLVQRVERHIAAITAAAPNDVKSGEEVEGPVGTAEDVM